MLRNLLCIFVAVSSLLVLFPLACVAMLVRLDPAVSLWIARTWWAPLLLWAGGARLVVEGEENVDPRRPTIYASNHQSRSEEHTSELQSHVNLVCRLLLEKKKKKKNKQTHKKKKNKKTKKIQI